MSFCNKNGGKSPTNDSLQDAQSYREIEKDANRGTLDKAALSYF